jgi:hypothetical protein
MKYTNYQLNEMAKPASDSEETRMENAIRMVKDALYGKGVIPDREYEVFAQGSYANNTNVRNNSDVDINICYTGAFFYDIPDGTTKEQYGLTNPSTYSYSRFKDDVERLLVLKFGRDQVVRKNKCIHIKENTYRTDIDVVPTWRYRRYVSPYNNSFVEGVKLVSDTNEVVLNFPKQHLLNGRQHNVDTYKRYKKLVRITKRIHINMENDGYYKNQNITSFLLESMVYLLPNRFYRLYTDSFDWNDVLKDAIVFWYNATKDDNDAWKKWTEVSELLLLMTGHKWTRSDVNVFTYKMWYYLEFDK